uniref:annexin A7-like n=1 Tax=Styela clava TaxID=7725 RepID=UPI00193A0B0A|nr:annexin A7-like [Styela clava]
MGKKKLVYEDPIVPVFIDRDQELQAYYSCVDALARVNPPVADYNPYPTQPAQGQWQPQPSNPYPNTWQGYSYPSQPQTGYPNAPPQPTGYPPMPAQQPYPGYAPNPAYTYPQVPGYPPAPQNSYGAPMGYGGYQQPAMPAAQGNWPAYGQPQPYGAYGQTPQPTPYQATPYPAYPGYQNPTSQPGHEKITQKHMAPEHSDATHERSPSAPPGDTYQPQAPSNYGWGDFMFSGYDNQYYRPPSAPTSSFYSGMQPVEETVTVSQSSKGYINDDYYAKQFERLQIGWNV